MLDPAGLRVKLLELVLRDGGNRAASSKRIARELVVPWSSARTYAMRAFTFGNQSNTLGQAGARSQPSQFGERMVKSRIESYQAEIAVPMRSTQQFSITLTHEMAEMVRAKVKSGEYASESEVIRDGLRALQPRERALDTWLRDQVAPTYDAMKAKPSRSVSAARVRASLAAAHKSSRKAPPLLCHL